MVMINMPRLVKSGKQTDTLQVYDATVSLNITPLSTAVFTLKAGAKVDTRAFYEVYTELGSAGIFRARSPRIGVGSQLTTVDLDHAIVEVGDYLITDDIEQEMTLSSALKKVFTFYKGGKWKLGTVKSGSTKVVLKANYDTCLDAILDLISQVPKVYLTFDFSAYPWTVNVANRPTTISAEGRISRNVKSAVISRDDTELCTRVYLEGLPGTSGNKFGHIDADTLKKYGTVEREITGTNSSEAIAKKTAEAYLEKHKHPAYSIQIEAIDLSAITGETLDKFTIGKPMRLALPDEGITVEETISQITWGNVYTNPKGMTIVLSDEKDTIVKTIKDSAKASGGGGGGGSNGKKIQKLFTRFDQTDEYIDMWAAESDTQGQILKQAGMYLDKNGVIQYAKEIQYDEDGKVSNTLMAQIETRADKIEQTVANTKEDLQAKITTQANRISLVVEGTGKNAHIKPASIVAAINNGSSEVKISADHIVLDGEAVATSLSGQTIECNSITAWGTCTFADDVTFSNNISVSGQNMAVANVTADGNVLTITYVDGETDTFSKATSLSGEWSGNVAAGKSYKVEATQNGVVVNTIYSPALDGMTFRANSKVWDTNKKGFKQTLYVYDEDSNDLYEEELHFDTEDSYNAGEGSVTLSGAWNGNTASGKSYKVTASNGKTAFSPQIDDIYQGVKDWAGDKKSFVQTITVQDENGTDLYYERMEFDTSSSYYAGSASVGIGSISTSGGSSTNSSRTLKCSTTGRTNTSGTSDNSSTTYEIALQHSGNYVYCKHGGTTICRISVI